MANMSQNQMISSRTKTEITSSVTKDKVTNQVSYKSEVNYPKSGTKVIRELA